MEDIGIKLVLLLVFGLVVGAIKGIAHIIGSPAERAARDLHDAHQVGLVRQQQVQAAEDVATRCEYRASQLIEEFPNLGDYEIATLIHDELTNMRSPHRAYYDWAIPANVARVRRTMAVEAIRAKRAAGEDV